MSADDDTRPRIGDFSIGMWSGDTLFLSGVIGFDGGVGRVVEGYNDLPPDATEKLSSGHRSIDLREGPIVAQAWVAYSLIDAALRSEGLSFDNVVKITHYLTDFTDFPAYNRVRNIFLGESPPASTVVEVTQLLPSPATRLEVDVVACRGKPVGLGPVGTDWKRRA
jgi:enamine deaminase RidA (YjgF/YER057c/UK114 family)